MRRTTELFGIFGTSVAVALAVLVATQGGSLAVSRQPPPGRPADGVDVIPARNAASIAAHTDERNISASPGEFTLAELAAKAEAILTGKVTDIACYEEGKGDIYTLVTLAVDETIKGNPAQAAVIRVPGGVVDGLGLWVSDSPEFARDESVVVFLQSGEKGFKVYGQRHGKFTVERGRVKERNQALASFRADIYQAMEAMGVKSSVSWRVTSEVYEGQASTLVQPAKLEALQAGWQNILTDGFEGAFPGQWTVGVNTGKTNAYWGKDASNVHGGSYSAFCARSGTAGVSPPAYYPNNMSAWMIYGPFSLVGAAAAELNFYRWWKTELDHDYFNVLASVNGSSYYGYSGSGDYSSWQYDSFDLTAWPTLGNLCGQSQVWIAFRFDSDSATTNQGAWVDDVVLRKYVGSPPHINSISPASGSAGTDLQVTIAGTGFGASQGSGGVTFWRVDSTYIAATIVSWSDTQIVCKVPSGASSGDTSDGVWVYTPPVGSNDYPFTVTFSYGGAKWPGANPMGQKVWINPNTADCTGEWRAVIDAMQTWNSVTAANFYFEYAGLTAATDRSRNYLNEIMWVNYDTGSIATASVWYDASSGVISECDIRFNDLSYTWDTSGSPSASQRDVQSTATHELGHWLYLLDLYGSADQNKTMYGYGSLGQTSKRTLETDDIAGIRWVYPGTGTRGQYHVKVTNKDDDNLTIYFKSDIDADYSRSFEVPAGQTLTSWWEVAPAGSHQVSIRWTDPDKGTADFLTSAWSNVAVEGDTEFSFGIGTFTITATAGPGGSISPSGAVVLSYGASQTFNISPSTGFHIATLTVDGSAVTPAVASYTFSNVTANHTIAVTFAINTYTITASAGPGGTISPSGAVTVNYGANQTFNISPSTGYHIVSLTVGGSAVTPPVLSYTFSNVTANHTIAATFAINTYTITASAGPNGSIAPSGAVTVNYGANQTFNISPSTGYRIDTLTVDGSAVTPPVASYTFSNVTANHTIAVTFADVASKLAFNPAPATPVLAGAVWAPFKVQILDREGNLTASTASVTVTPSAGSWFAGTFTKAAVAGVATFDDLKYTTAGTITVAASSGTLAGATSGSVVVNHSSLDHIDISPANPTVLVQADQQFTATGKDQYNNTVPSLTFTWSVPGAQSVAGTINSSTGLFTAGLTRGSYTGAVEATSGGVTGTTNVTVQGATVTATATLQGGSRPLAGCNVPLTVKLFSSTTNPTVTNILTATPLYTTSTANGKVAITNANQSTKTITFNITDLPLGTFDVSLFTPHALITLKNDLAIAVTNPTTVSMGTLLEGNADDDVQIAGADFSILLNDYLATSASAAGKWNSGRCDFDRNGQVTAIDFTLLAINYNLTSPQGA